MVKKSWQKPKVIVLIRGNSDEAVLTICKTGDPGGPCTNFQRCSWSNYVPGECIQPPSCSTVANS
jgi:hypothetical protein